MSIFFNPTFYLSNNPDVLQAVTQGTIPSAEFHFNEFGYKEGRDPNAFFDVDYYLINNPDVLAAGVNPLAHFIEFGAAEGRSPSATFVTFADFDTEAYAAANSDLTDAGLTTPAQLYAHFATYGFGENRPGVQTVDGNTIEMGVPSLGGSFTLTTGVDNVQGGTADDVFNATLSVGIDGLVGVQTLQGADVVNGGAGFNTLNIELNSTGTTANPTISNVQVYNMTSFAGPLFGFGNGALDLDRATGYEQLWNIDSRSDLEVYNVGEVAILGMDNVRNGSTYSVEYDGIAVAEQNVVAINSGRPGVGNDVALNISGVAGNIGTMNLAVAMGTYLTLSGRADGATNLNITGDGILELGGASGFAGLVNLDTATTTNEITGVTGYVGDVVLNVSGSTVLESVVTGAGDDIITINNQTVDGGLSVDLGEGVNALAITGVFDDVELSALDFTGGVVGVQTLQLLDAIELDDDATLDLTGFDVSPANIAFVGGIDGHEDLNIVNSAADLNITGSLIDLEALSGGFENLAVTTTGYLHFHIDGSVENLETLVASSTMDDAELYLIDAPSLVSVELTALNDAYLEVDTDWSGDDTENLDALETIDVAAQTGDAYVDIGGNTDGSMLSSLTTVDISAAESADVYINDVSGEFALDVQAGFAANAVSGTNNLDAYVDMANVGVTSVNVVAGDDADVYIDNAPNLVSVDVMAGATTADGYTSNAYVQLDADEDNFDSLTTVNVSATDDATLEMTGEAGQPGVRQVQTFTIAAGASVNTGSYVFNLPGFGLLNVPIGGAEGPYANNTSSAVAEKVINAINGVPGYSAEWTGGVIDPKLVTVTFDEEAAANWIQLVDAGNRAITENMVDRVEGQELIAGEGFDGLETITVVAGEDADVELEDVSGNFDLSIAAGDDAYIYLTNTGAVTVTVVAADYVDLDVQGDTIGNSSLTTITVTSDTADITLADDMASFTTLDVSGVVTDLTVDASAAEYDDFVTYQIGATETVDFTAQDYTMMDSHREVFEFVGADIGAVVIDNFDLDPIAAVRDALDFSAFANITGAANLAFADDAGDLVITAADGQFDGSITLAGLAGQEAFVSDFSIIYT